MKTFRWALIEACSQAVGTPFPELDVAFATASVTQGMPTLQLLHITGMAGMKGASHTGKSKHLKTQIPKSWGRGKRCQGTNSVSKKCWFCAPRNSLVVGGHLHATQMHVDVTGHAWDRAWPHLPMASRNLLWFSLKEKNTLTIESISRDQKIQALSSQLPQSLTAIGRKCFSTSWIMALSTQNRFSIQIYPTWTESTYIWKSYSCLLSQTNDWNLTLKVQLHTLYHLLTGN